MKIAKGLALFSVLILMGVPAWPLGPHECALIVNRRSMASVELANYYADLRQIPTVNIIQLDLPEKALEADASLSPEEFRTHIYDPVIAALQERQLTSHILAWIYSVDFPATVSTAPPMSLTGITFVRGQPPPGEDIQSGLWPSPLYRGPDRADGPASPPISLEHFAVRLTTNMPLPSMMLGWSGSRGLTSAHIKQQLRRSAAADGSQPSASVFFEINDNVRSTTRQWQFEPAVRELAALGVLGIASANLPVDRSDLMGVLGGRAGLSAAQYGTLRAGAYADHLTSFAALFHDPEQTKLTEWLRHGAAGSSGTVVEPGSLEVPVMLWAKFPTARLFVHYAAGCALLESLYQSIRSPLQLLLVGDALAAPWSKPPGVTLISMAEDETAPVRGRAEFLASAWGGFGEKPPMHVFLLDGRPVPQPGNQPKLTFDSTRLHDGYHELRAIAYADGTVRHQGMATLGFLTRNRGRGVTLSGYQNREKVDLYRPLTFHVHADGKPGEVALVAQERIVARAAYSNGLSLSIHPMQVGAGPIRFQAVAVYEGKEPVRSEPLILDIAPLNRPPVIERITRITNGTDGVEWSMTASDPDKDALESRWYVELLRQAPPAFSPAGQRGTVNREDTSLLFAATNASVSATYTIEQPHRIKELYARFRFLPGGDIQSGHSAGIVFNYRDENNYMRWGAHGRLSAWALTRVQDGRASVVLSRGSPIETGRDYILMAVQVAPQKMALFVDDEAKAVADVRFGPGGTGVHAGTLPVRYDTLAVSPPSAVNGLFREEEARVVLPVPDAGLGDYLLAGARDNQFTVLTSERRLAEDSPAAPAAP